MATLQKEVDEVKYWELKSTIQGLVLPTSTMV
jgi:hypothetical protein